jgi:hypothetical protein
MKNQDRKRWRRAVLAAVCFALGAFAQNLKSKEDSNKAATSAPSAVQSAGGVNTSVHGKIAQKLVVMVPESPTALLLGADLLGLAAIMLLFRKRQLDQGVRVGESCASQRNGH